MKLRIETTVFPNGAPITHKCAKRNAYHMLNLRRRSFRRRNVCRFRKTLRKPYHVTTNVRVPYILSLLSAIGHWQKYAGVKGSSGVSEKEE